MHGIPPLQSNAQSTCKSMVWETLLHCYTTLTNYYTKHLLKYGVRIPTTMERTRAETSAIVQFTKNHCASTPHTKADCTQVLPNTPSKPKQSRVRPDPQRHLSAPHPDLIVCMPYNCDTAVIKNKGGKNLKITTFSFRCPMIPHSE